MNYLSIDEKKHGPVRTSKPTETPSSITLTNDQAEALYRMLEWESTRDRFFLLSGYAGTGKTTVMQHYIRDSNKQVVLTAPTNKAVRVLEQMAGDHGLAVECLTLHRLLGLRIQKDASEKYCDREGDATIPDFDVLVVDECSMVGNEPTWARGRQVPGLFDQLNQQLDEWKKQGYYIKVIFVGDPAQLPPIRKDDKKELSLTFRCTENSDHCVFLEAVVRQAFDNPIIQLATYIRLRIYDQPAVPPRLFHDGERGVYQIRDPKEFLEFLIKAYKLEANYPTKYKGVTFNNKKSADIYNEHIRRALYGEDAPKWIRGERYVTTAPVYGQVGGRYVTHATTDEEVEVIDIKDALDAPPIASPYRPQQLTVVNTEGTIFPALVPHPTLEEQWLQDCETARRKAVITKRWKPRWAIKDAFAYFKPHYMMTTHRAQGSTYETVFVDAINILDHYKGPWEAYRCLYTAVTRASESIVLLSDRDWG